MTTLLVIAVGCKGGDAAEKPPIGVPPKPPKDLALPRIADAAHVMVVENGHPGALVWVGTTGSLEVGKTGPTWSGDLDAPDRIAVTDVDTLGRVVLETIVAGGGPLAPIAKASLDDEVQVARLRAIQQARTVGLGISAFRANPGAQNAGRLPSMQGMAFEMLAKTTPLVLAVPSAPAVALVRAGRRAGGMLGVSFRGQLAVLDLGFVREVPGDFSTSNGWVELLTDPKGLHVIVQPAGTETLVPVTERDKLRVAYEAARNDPTGNARPVDVLVNEGMTAQSLVDLLVVLESIGVTKLAVADGPRTFEERKEQIALARIGDRGAIGTIGNLGRRSGVPTVSIGQPNAQGDLDKAIIRRYVKRNIQKIQYCYEKMLLAKPQLSGTVSTQFFIDPEGKVTTATGAGVDPEVASCVANVIKGIEFPKPKGGGGVQVNYPFTFRPAEP